MAEGQSIGLEAFSKLIEPVIARMEAIEQRLERIDGTLARLALPFANSSPPTMNHRGGLFSDDPVPPAPQKRSPDMKSSESASVSPELYQYRALDSSRNEIRILSLDPSLDHKGRLRGNLLHMSLDNMPRDDSLFQKESLFDVSRSTYRYKALSYAWGELTSSGSSSSLSIAGASLRLTENLDHALRRLRKDIKPTEMSSYWWIDAICINQDDVEERNSQVALMRRIYGSAMQVQVWLGDEYDGSTEAIGLVKQLASPRPRGPAHPETVYPDNSDETKLKNLVCVSSLFQRPWWDRVWIRQEVALGCNVNFLCGDASCTFEELIVAERAL